MADVFISYKSTRKRAVQHLAQILERHGYSVWYDYQLVAGKNFGKQIEKKLSQAKAVLVLWCDFSVDSDWVREEADFAKNSNKIIPVWMQDTKPPVGFRLIQTVDLSTWDGNPKASQISALIEQLKIVTGQSPKTDLSAIDSLEKNWLELGQPSFEDFELLSSSPLSNMVEEPRFTKIASSSGRFAISWVMTGLIGGSILTASAAIYLIQNLTPETALEYQDQCALCPEMVVVEPGEFILGSPHDDELAEQNERPPIAVRIDTRFAISKYEITREQFLRFAELKPEKLDTEECIAADGSSHLQNPINFKNPGFQQDGREPVVCVSWHDANQFTIWLSDLTGATYRLPSEAEWEYVATEGGNLRLDLENPATICDHGNIGDEMANLAQGRYADAACEDGTAYTAAVGLKPSNEFGVFDTIGNVSEWVADCWTASYSGEVKTGRPVERPDCETHVVRGGAWESEPYWQRFKARSSGDHKTGTNFYGFRVVRELDQ